VVTSWPTTFDLIHGGVEKLAKDIETASKGDIKINVFPAGTKVGALQIFDAVGSGNYEMGYTASYYYLGKDIAHAFFTGMPFGLSPEQHAKWLEAEGQTLWNELNAKDNLIAFAAGNTGPQAGGWFRDVLTSSEDLKGLKMRIPGFGGKVMAMAGVEPQVYPGNEIYQALENRELDATEWIGPYDDEQMQFYKIANNYYFPGWHEPSAAIGLYINLDVYKGMPCHLQEIVKTSSQEVNTWMLEEYKSKNAGALERLKAEGVQIRDFPADILTTLKTHADTVEAEAKTNSEFYKRIWQSWNRYR